MVLGFNASEIIEFTKIYLAVFYSIVATFYTFRLINKKRQNGKSLVFSGKPFCKTWWNHIAFRFFRISIWMVCLFRLFYPNIDNYLGMINILELPSVITLGLILLTVGFLSTALIHYSLGKEWRSGIDPSGPARVITSGAYQFSRNPMFVCIAVAQLGFFFAMPSIFSLVCLTIGLYTLNSQTLEEEIHLSKKFPIEYAAYASKVRRWV
ncbi:methyltransferase family protein [Colwellia psychrerythraea]|uniref:Putative membrane protein n=1 Tax=Colwellia psychrerythraea (strain 34H / ATCC BAA-681) TaxID=167879 RepID=Q480F3_COLP3|nr:isoprenylcysteine carboxylmethyltransferase family protein [Colwellia psychrerythraea]AAZ27676.1 putative membrane protein [Colwellia psychrerythraea 34H]